MQITVISKDNKVNVFENQKEDLLEDVLTAVTAGTGFALFGPRGVIAYGPGTVARVGFTKREEKKS